MIDETDISIEKEWLYQERARMVVSNLQRKNINAQYTSNRGEALPSILDMIPEGVTVARGDSITVDQVGVIPELRKRNQNYILDPFERNADGSLVVKSTAQMYDMQRATFTSDVFITGTNAVTLDGKLVNVDGRGNRVAAMIFGPKKVILVISANKIVKDVDEALQRIRQIAAPINAKRHYVKHHVQQFADLPCVRTGRCADCNHDWGICRYTVIIDGVMAREKERINVVLIGEELGI